MIGNDDPRETLWELPAPSTELRSVSFEIRSASEVALAMLFAVDTATQRVDLVFIGVESFKLTHDRARSEWMIEAYDRLTDEGQTPWRDEIAANLRRRGDAPDGLRHLAIDFDQGPCFEAICRDFRVVDV